MQGSGVLVPVVVPVGGEERTGAAGMAVGVEKDHTADQELVLPALRAFTRQ